MTSRDGLPRVRVALLWHLHQPRGRDPLGGGFVRPCARRHALADHLGMVELLRETPEVRVTFSLSPVLGDEWLAGASGAPADPLRRASARAVEELDDAGRALLLATLADPSTARRAARFPRWRQLDARRRASPALSLQELRDVQVLATLAYCDRDRCERDPVLRALAAKGSGYDRDDQVRLGECEAALLAAVLPAYRAALADGQIELCVTPYDQPLLPLVCDTDVHHEAHPGAALPRRYAHPDDAGEQLQRALDWQRAHFGRAGVGLWPPEAALSQAVLGEMARAGLRWTVGDEGLLERSLRRGVARDARGLVHPLQILYRPWLCRTSHGDVTVLFRDRLLSDLIAFSYAREDPRQAAEDLIARLRRVGRAWREQSLDGEPVVGLALAGDRAWEHYPDGGRGFLRAFYGELARDPELRAVTLSEALEGTPAFELARLASGSWRPGELSAWIGQADQNRAWGLLGEARDVLEASRGHVPPAAWGRAHEALHAASAADWFCAYGEQPPGDWHIESDRLFRRQLEAVHHWLGLPVPESLRSTLISTRPGGPTRVAVHTFVPHLDGDGAEHVAWSRAAVWAVPRVGAGGAAPHALLGHVVALRYGRAGGLLHVRIETTPAARELLERFDVAVSLVHRVGPRYRVRGGGLRPEVQREERTAHGWVRLPTRAVAAVDQTLDLGVPFAELRRVADTTLGLRVALLRFEAEIERHPDAVPLWLDLGPTSSDGSHA